MTVWEKLKSFFGPSVKAWLKAALQNLGVILSSPQAIDFYISLITAALSLTAPEAIALWNIIIDLVRKAEAKHAGEVKAGAVKYQEVSDEFAAGNHTVNNGEPVGDFRFDYILHLVLAAEKKTKELKEQAAAKAAGRK